MTMFVEILMILIFLLIVKVLDDTYSLLVFGAFMAFITANMDTYFGVTKTAASDYSFWIITGIITALTFVKIYWITSKQKEVIPNE